jgi:hypothetical protein
MSKVYSKKCNELIPKKKIKKKMGWLFWFYKTNKKEVIKLNKKLTQTHTFNTKPR